MKNYKVLIKLIIHTDSLTGEIPLWGKHKGSGCCCLAWPHLVDDAANHLATKSILPH